MPELVVPAGAGEEVRESIRARAKASTYVTAGIIGFHDITPRLHLEMCDWIDRGASRKLGLVPRDHLKSSVWTIAHSLNLIINNPNIRILIGNETATNASHFLRRIMAVFERNVLFQWLFPELIPDWQKKGKWSENEMLIPRSEDYTESTIETIGVGGAVVSRHYNHIKLDDLVGKEASESADVMVKTIDWYQYCESLLNAPTDTIDLFGTRWAHNDVYSWAEAHETGLDKFFRSIYNEDGEPIWPERFPREEIERIRTKYGPFKFSCQYQNHPFDPESGGFVESWLRYWRWGGAGGCPLERDIVPDDSIKGIPVSTLNRFMRVDPAISERPGAARSAIVVDGVHRDGRKFLLETWAKRCHPFEMISKIFDLQEQYDCLSIGIEGVAYQRILKPVIEAEAERRGTWLNVILFNPDKREKKENRIRGIQPECERGNIWVRRDQQDFLEEYRQFPLGATVDVLDAWAYGPHQWSTPVDDVSDEEELEKFERAYDDNNRSPVTGY